MSNMLTHAQESLIRSLNTKKGRTESGFCLVEGEKNVAEAKEFIEFTFTPQDSIKFEHLVSTETPQAIAAVARIPVSSFDDILKNNIIVVLDGVQDPGNVGTILRLCLGFNASLLLVESADPSNPKVVRASAGAFFSVPWLSVKRDDAPETIAEIQGIVYRLENNKKATQVDKKFVFPKKGKIIIIAGSEGQGISLSIKGESLAVPHSAKLESLNVAAALAIILAHSY